MFSKHKGIQKTVIAIGSIVLLIIGTGAFAQVADGYPKPVSEYAEQTGPGTMTFLGYPKYYQDAENRLRETETTLRTSDDPDWDYAVTTGIWTLRVRLDGTFQAEHAGDVFTYRFSQLGVGRGEAFRAFDWGEPDWSNAEVQGNSIVWRNVFPDVDLQLRYISDILKVDVIIREALRNRITDDLNRGLLESDSFITAKFDIPNIMLTSQVWMNEKSFNLYNSEVELSNTLKFIKGDKVVHRLRPVVSYIMDSNGKRIESMDSGSSLIQSSQLWTLKQNGSGVASISALLSDIAKAPKGDLVIDPSEIFMGEGFYGGGDTYDAYISEGSPTTNYGTNDYLYLGGQSNNEKRSLLGFCHVGSLIGDRNVIDSAYLYIRQTYNPGSSYQLKARAYKVTTDWYMSSVTWNASGLGGWDNYGGDYDSSCYSPEVTMPTTDGYVEFDVTELFKSFYDVGSCSSITDIGDRGFLIKRTGGNTTDYDWRYNSSENESYRPYLIVNLTFKHYISFYHSNLILFNNNQADEMISSTNEVIQTDDGTGDYYTDTILARDGDVSSYQSNLFVIEDGDDYDDVCDILDSLSGEHKVYIVFGITIGGNSYDGYAEIGGRNIVLEPDTDFLLGHEIGHNLGLNHASNIEYLMNSPTNLSVSKKLRADDKNAFESKTYCSLCN